ncbi:MAG TPA: AraC family transcriptional regulator [Ktedonobacteraceae bacterium]|nr:AraC family transcriptional regulator [Ktedonobacteraceae bacterium]
MKETPPVPHSTSTEDFEKYLPTSPLLSSREVGWQHMMVRTYREPAILEETFFPGGSDVYLVLVTGGHVQFAERKVDGPWITHAISAGDWFLTPAGGEPYALRWKSQSPGPLTTLHLHLNNDLFVRTVRQVVDRDPARVLLQERSGFQDPLLAQVALSLQQELQHPASNAIGRLYAETSAQMLIAHLLRRYTTTAVSIPEPGRRLSSQQMQRLTDFILAHLHQNLSLEMLAQQVGFSPYHFARLFRHTTGESPHQFVLRQRLEAARRLLKETNLPLAQIALETGFPHQSHFTQAFKRYLGTTPFLYRQES